MFRKNQIPYHIRNLELLSQHRMPEKAVHKVLPGVKHRISFNIIINLFHIKKRCPDRNLQKLFKLITKSIVDIYKAMQEDGIWNFSWELLQTCDRDELDEREKYYIELYQSKEYGYNSTAGNK